MSSYTHHYIDKNFWGKIHFFTLHLSNRQCFVQPIVSYSVIRMLFNVLIGLDQKASFQSGDVTCKDQQLINNFATLEFRNLSDSPVNHSMLYNKDGPTVQVF